jgi:thiaminase/transcriptional activator TenA
MQDMHRVEAIWLKIVGVLLILLGLVLFASSPHIITIRGRRLPPMATNSLIRGARTLWHDATHSPFLDAMASGTLPADGFRRWLSQDYLFTSRLLVFQAILLAKAPRDCHQLLIGGLGALDKELAWFESHAARLQVDLDIPAHPICRRYADFLLRCVYIEPHSVLLAILFGVEASYLAAWSAQAPIGPYAEFIGRWSSADFAAYVAALGNLAEQHYQEAAQEYFNEVLVHERDFWKMSWEG